MKIIALFFGEMGSGKSYLGRRYAAEHGFTFVEGDSLLPPDMRDRVTKFRPPTKGQLLQLVDNLKSEGARACDWSPKGAVITQALYRNEHRIALIQAWIERGYIVRCFWVRTPFWQNIKQLWKRSRGLRWVSYWLASRPWFEKPTHAVIPLFNVR